jgi:hypothetical protein
MSRAVRHRRKRIEKDAPEARVNATVREVSDADRDGCGECDGENAALAGMQRTGLGEAPYFLDFRGIVERLKKVKGADVSGYVEGMAAGAQARGGSVRDGSR